MRYSHYCSVAFHTSESCCVRVGELQFETSERRTHAKDTLLFAEIVREKLDKKFWSLHLTMLRIAMKSGQSLKSWFSRNFSDLCSQEETSPDTGTTGLTIRRPMSKPSSLADTHTLSHFVQSLLPLMNSSTPQLSYPIQTYSPLSIRKNFSMNHRALLFLSDSSKSDVISSLYSSSVLVQVSTQTTSDTSSPRKRTARDTLFQSLSYQHFLSIHSLLSLQKLRKKRRHLQAAKKLVSNFPESDLSWLKCASVINLTSYCTRAFSALLLESFSK